MSNVRCKFTVTSVTHYQGEAKRITLTPQYDPELPEDQRFSKYTPSGSLEMTVDNPSVVEALQIGKAFYLDLVPVE